MLPSTLIFSSLAGLVIAAPKPAFDRPKASPSAATRDPLQARSDQTLTITRCQRKLSNFCIVSCQSRGYDSGSCSVKVRGACICSDGPYYPRTLRDNHVDELINELLNEEL